MKKNKIYDVGNLIRIFLQMFFVVGVLILIFLYNITKYFNIHFDWFIFMIYPCGILFLCLVYEFINLFKTLENKNPFCMDNVKRFRYNMIFSFIICILVLLAFFIASFGYNYYSAQLKVALLFISLLFFAASIAFYILAGLFKQATIYKEENDLTI